MAILSFVIVSILIIRHSLYGVKGSNVCLDRTGKSICCFNYEEVNGGCVECTRGSTSWDGGPCLPCKDNTYGIRCLKTCNCNYLQRCDPVIGCVISTVTSESSTSVIGETETNTKYVTITTLSENDNNYITDSAHTETGSLHITVDTMPQNDDDIKILSGGWIFSFCTFGIVLLICVLILFWKLRSTKKLQIKGTQALDRDRQTNQTISLQHHEYIDVENEYEEIDDNFMVETSCQWQEKKKTVSIDSKSSSERSYVEPENNGSYLYPCHIPEDEFEGRKSSDDSNDSSINHINEKDSSDYLNPYQSLQQSSEKVCHIYERNTIVYKTSEECFDIETIHDLNSYRMSVGSFKSTNNRNLSSSVVGGHEYIKMQILHLQKDCDISKKHVMSLELSNTLVNKCNSVPVALNMTEKRHRFARNSGKNLHLSNEYF